MARPRPELAPVVNQTLEADMTIYDEDDEDDQGGLGSTDCNEETRLLYHVARLSTTADIHGMSGGCRRTWAVLNNVALERFRRSLVWRERMRQ